MKDLIIIGAGGYAKSVLDSVDYMNFRMVGFIDDYKEEKEHLGYPIIGHSFEDIQNPAQYVYFVAIGNNSKRKQWYERLKENNLACINVIDRSAIVSKNASVGENCFIGKLSIVNSYASVGNNCVINTKSLLEHGVRVYDHANVSTNTALNGDVCVKEGGFVGSSSVINGQLTIGSWSMVGSGAVVIHDVPDGMTVVGIPAKIIKKNTI